MDITKVGKVGVNNLIDGFNGGDKTTLYTIISLTLIIAVLLLFFSWVGNTLSLNVSNCNKYKKQFDSLNESYGYKSIYKDCMNSRNSESLYCNIEISSLRNFYIKTAYNCCNSGGYKNNWVHLCALQNALKLGARCLDFEVYSLKHKPIIASSTNTNFSFKETFNYLTLEEVLDEIANGEQNTFSIKGDYREPLLLHFRIKSEHVEMFKNMGEIIKNKLYGNGPNGLLHPAKGSRGSENIKGIDRYLLKDLNGKIIIMVDSPYNSLIKTIPELHDVINLYSQDHYKVYRISQIDSENELLKSSTKNKLHIILPDLNNKLSNYDFSEPFKNGCQLMAMKFQQNDLNLRSYFDLFKNSDGRGQNNIKNASYILKHGTLRQDEYIAPDAAPDQVPVDSLGTYNSQNDKIFEFTLNPNFSYEYQDNTWPIIKIEPVSYSPSQYQVINPNLNKNKAELTLRNGPVKIKFYIYNSKVIDDNLYIHFVGVNNGSFSKIEQGGEINTFEIRPQGTGKVLIYLKV